MKGDVDNAQKRAVAVKSNRTTMAMLRPVQHISAVNQSAGPESADDRFSIDLRGQVLRPSGLADLRSVL